MRTASLIFIIFFLSNFVVVFGGEANFSGEWSLNKEKSEMGERRGRMTSTKLVVAQDSDKINIKRTGQGRNGEYTREEEITLDGKENELEGFR